MGFVELLTVLLSLGGFGVAQNPNAPSADVVLTYAPTQADYMAYLDVQSLVPQNFAALTQLEQLPAIRSDKRMRKAASEIVAEVSKARDQVRDALGIDPVTDVYSVAAWLSVPDAGDPSVLIIVRGKFPKDIIERFAKMVGAQPEPLKGRMLVRSPDGETIVSTTDDGSIVLGTPRMVQPRMTGWKPARRGKSGLYAQASTLLADKPFAMLVSAPSKAVVRRIERELRDRDEALPRDLFTGHESGGVALFYNGVSWSFKARTKSGYERALTASEGIVQLMRAAHLGARGFARVVLAAIASYRDADPMIATIVDNERDILKLVDQTTGDGNFKVSWTRNAGSRTVGVDARGAKLSEVMPAAGLLPVFAGAAFFALARDQAEAPPPPVERRHR